jgi:hypothetical protein
MFSYLIIALTILAIPWLFLVRTSHNGIGFLGVLWSYGLALLTLLGVGGIYSFLSDIKLGTIMLIIILSICLFLFWGLHRFIYNITEG